MYYFASDVHLGGGTPAEARETENRFVEWLDRVAVDAEAVILCGDIFDLWFEHKRVVPKGFTRTLGAISRLTDRGVRVIFMVGNHDMWIGSYLSEECGMELYTSPTTFELSGKRVHVAHGNRLSKRDGVGLKIMNWVFNSKFIFNVTASLLHPDLLLKFGQWWSRSSRKKHSPREGHNTIEGDGVQPLIDYATNHQRTEPCDYYIYGHLHQRLVADIEGGKVIFINDWSEEPYIAKLNREGEMILEKA